MLSDIKINPLVPTAKPPKTDPVDPQLIADLIRDEGEILHAYKDSEGYWTIGVGILIDPRRGGSITREESRYLLVHRIESKSAELDNHIPWWRSLSVVRQRVLLNMAFNMGVGVGDGTGGLLDFHIALALMKSGDYPAAAKAMLESKWARKVGDRAKRLAAEMAAG